MLSTSKRGSCNFLWPMGSSHVFEGPWTSSGPRGRQSAARGSGFCLRSSCQLPLQEKIDPTIGPRLRHIRLEKGLTVEALAAAAGLDKGFLSRLERGTKRPSVETVLRLSAALGVPVGQLFGEQTAEDTVRASRALGRSRSFEGPDAYSFELLTPKGGLVEAFLFHIGAEPVGKGQQH